MRDAPYSLDDSHARVSPPAYTASAAPPPYPSPKCDAQRCPWWPYSSSKEFKANTALVIVILICALVCGLAFNSAVRYAVRRHRRRRRRRQAENGKPEIESVEPDAEIPVLDYAEGMKLAGEETECLVCLAEFAIGEKIRVLDDCKHGFHVNCIQQWLLLHSSCPTCRTKCSVKPLTPP